MDIIMEIDLSSCENNGIDTASDRKPSSSEYANDVVTEWRPKSKLPARLDRLDVSVSMPVMHFAPLKCQMLPQEWSGSELNPGLAEE